MLLRPRAQLRLFQLFMSSSLWKIWVTRPRIVLKHLHKYLHLDCTPNDRLVALLYHYEFLLARMHPQFLSKLVHRPPILWEQEVAEKKISISLTFPAPDDQEGDLALVLNVDAECVFILSFSIAPSSCFGESIGTVLFVGRVQGLTGTENIRETCRLCGEVDPSAMLMAALTGFARSVGIERIYGVTTASQLSSNRDDVGRRLVFNYNGFWEKMYGKRESSCFFILECPLPRRPLNSIVAKHRKRALLKRTFKDAVAARVASSMREHVLR